jgi:alginate O-acetyltransferase complex protein AlgI
MQFPSLNFFIFILIVFILNYLLPKKFQWGLMLIASLLFYSFFGVFFLFVVTGVVLLNYFIGKLIIAKGGEIRKSYFFTGILLNILILSLFKYSDFLVKEFQLFSKYLHLNYPPHIINIVMPVGFSFLIVSTISYLIDVKKKLIEPERNSGLLAAHFLFFPKVMSGPIERAGNFIPQLNSKHTFRYDTAEEGIRLIILGFFKKLVIADRLAISVNFIYSNSANMPAPQLIIGTFFFAVQLYCDFSGYSDMAVGFAKILGYDLTQNFRHPYLAVSIKDFWRRWHISLSVWMRDYLFFPLAYAAGRKMKNDSYFKIPTDRLIYVFSTLITFIICGIWHGVGWTFFVWGLIFGVYLGFDNLTQKLRKKIYRKSGISKFPTLYKTAQILTTLILVNFAWIFFRSESITQSVKIIRSIFLAWPSFTTGMISATIAGLGIPLYALFISMTSLLLLIIYEILSEKKDLFAMLKSKKIIIRYSIYYITIMWIIVFGIFNDGGHFIYFDF